MPWATKIYKRDMDVTRYNVPFLLHPYIALYSTRGCPAQCTFCLWPQTLSGHAWRKRSSDDVAAEMKWAKEAFPEVKEFSSMTTLSISRRCAQLSSAKN